MDFPSPELDSTFENGLRCRSVGDNNTVEGEHGSVSFLPGRTTPQVAALGTAPAPPQYRTAAPGRGQVQHLVQYQHSTPGHRWLLLAGGQARTSSLC